MDPFTFILLLIFIFLLTAVSLFESSYYRLLQEEALDREKFSTWFLERMKKTRETNIFLTLTKLLLLLGVSVTFFLLVGNIFAHSAVNTFVELLVLWAILIIVMEVIPYTRRMIVLKKMSPDCLLVARLLYIILFPLTRFWGIFLGLYATEEEEVQKEIETLLTEEGDYESLEAEERQMIRHVVEFGDTTAREIMVPRIDMVALEVNTPVDEVIETITKCGHTRIPVYREKIDDIVGVLYVKDLITYLYERKPVVLKDIIREAEFVPEAQKIDDILRLFKRTRKHIAIVVDEYGGTAGLVTMEDVLEEIVGEIQDEYDTEEVLIQKINNAEYLVNAKINLDELNEQTGISVPSEEVDTLAGFLYNLANAIPKPGQKLSFGNLNFTIEEVVGQRIGRVRIRIKGREDE